MSFSVLQKAVLFQTLPWGVSIRMEPDQGHRVASTPPQFNKIQKDFVNAKRLLKGHKLSPKRRLATKSGSFG